MTAKKSKAGLTGERGLITTEDAGGFFVARGLRRGLFGVLDVLAHLLEPFHGALPCLLRDVGVVNGSLEAGCNAGGLFSVFCYPPRLSKGTVTQMRGTHQKTSWTDEKGRKAITHTYILPFWIGGLSS